MKQRKKKEKDYSEQGEGREEESGKGRWDGGGWIMWVKKRQCGQIVWIRS